MPTYDDTSEQGLNDATPALAAAAFAVWAIGLVALAAALVLLFAPTPPWP